MGPQKFCYTFFHYNTCFLGSFRPIACKIGSLSSVMWLYHVKWELGVECVQSGALWNDLGRNKGLENKVSVKCFCSREMRHMQYPYVISFILHVQCKHVSTKARRQGSMSIHRGDNKFVVEISMFFYSNQKNYSR